MVIVCNDQCRHHIMENYHNFTGRGFYCRTCTAYIKNDFLIGGRCGCCKSKVRPKPRYAAGNKRKLERMKNLPIIEQDNICERCGTPITFRNEDNLNIIIIPITV